MHGFFARSAIGVLWELVAAVGLELRLALILRNLLI